MREIKFRMWDELHQSMRYDDYAVLINGNGLIWLNQSESKFDRTLNQTIIMQFTGLKDKNGKETYEGDIVKIDNPQMPNNYPIFFFLGAFFICKEDFEDSGEYAYLHEWSAKAAIIGNIYEHPHLLKEGDQ